jgi:hypothetical protein
MPEAPIPVVQGTDSAITRPGDCGRGWHAFAAPPALDCTTSLGRAAKAWHTAKIRPIGRFILH